MGLLYSAPTSRHVLSAFRIERPLEQAKMTSWEACLLTSQMTRITDGHSLMVFCIPGPDQNAEHLFSWPRREVKLASSVLGLRGKEIASQPIMGQVGRLAWNGQIFARLNSTAQPPQSEQMSEESSEFLEKALSQLFHSVKQGKNDGESLLYAVDWLVQMCPQQYTGTNTPQALFDLLDRVDGPYAFCFVSPDQHWVAYGRDPLGRRSLLHHLPSDVSDVDDGSGVASTTDLVVTSCGTTRAQAGLGLSTLHEVPCDRYYVVHFADSHPYDMHVRSVPRMSHEWRLPAVSVPDPVVGPKQDVVDRLVEVLRASVQSRLPTIYCRSSMDGKGQAQHASLAILFSGGLDCTTLALLADESVPSEEPIDLLNVAFETSTTNYHPTEGQFGTPDRLTALEACAELQDLRPKREWRLVRINIPKEEYVAYRAHVVDCMAPSDTVVRQTPPQPF